MMKAFLGQMAAAGRAMHALLRLMPPDEYRKFSRSVGDIDPDDELVAAKKKLLEIAGTDDVEKIHADLNRKAKTAAS